MVRFLDLFTIINEPVILVESDGKTMIEGNYSDYSYRMVCNVRPMNILGTTYMIISLCDEVKGDKGNGKRI